MDAIAIPSHGAYTEDHTAAHSWTSSASKKQDQSHGRRPISLFCGDLDPIKNEPRTSHRPYTLVPDSSASPLHSRQPPSYDVPPAYNDVYTDLPPDYTNTAALAHAHIYNLQHSCDRNCDCVCANKAATSTPPHTANTMSPTDTEALLALSQKLKDLDFGLHLNNAPIVPTPSAPTIDWLTLINAREQVSKKQKKAQQKAQAAKWADSDNEGEGDGTKDGEGGEDGGSGEGAGSGAGGGGDGEKPPDEEDDDDWAFGGSKKQKKKDKKKKKGEEEEEEVEKEKEEPVVLDAAGDDDWGFATAGKKSKKKKVCCCCSTPRSRRDSSLTRHTERPRTHSRRSRQTRRNRPRRLKSLRQSQTRRAQNNSGFRRWLGRRRLVLWQFRHKERACSRRTRARSGHKCMGNDDQGQEKQREGEIECV